MADKVYNPGESQQVYYRGSQIESVEGANENTFQMAVASEYPGEQRAHKAHERLGIAKEDESFLEILSHDPADVDLSRFNNGASSFLDEHKDNRHLGPVHRAVISKDKVTRAVVECDNVSKLSKTRCSQLRKRSRPNTSMGYVHTRYLGKETLPDGRTAHRFAWAGVEISSVSAPMDPTVGLSRSASDEMCHCFGCGREMERAKMVKSDGALYCSDDCLNAEEPADDSNDARSIHRNFEKLFCRAQNGDIISLEDLRRLVAEAAGEDERFNKNNAGEAVNWLPYVPDVRIEEKGVQDGKDVDDYSAIIQSGAGKYFEVEFTVDNNKAKLGAATEVVLKSEWDPVERFLFDGQLVRADDPKKPYGDVEYADPGYQDDKKKRYPIDTKAHAKAAWSYINQKSNADKYTAEQLGHIKGKIKAALKKFGVEISDDSRSLVDSANLSNRTVQKPPTNLPIKNMKTAAELVTEAPEAVAIIQKDQEKITRAAVLGEVTAQTAKIVEFNTEVRALANEFCKTYGKRWNGPQSAVIVVGEEIRKLEAEICALDVTHEAAERRTDFKRKADILVAGSREPLNMVDAANVDPDLAKNCSLKRLWDKADEAFSRGDRRSCFMLSDGAEFEADRELRNKATSFPSGLGIQADGQLFPANTLVPTSRSMRSVIEHRMKRNSNRLTRDALASDFPTAGALIAPEYMTPIELLRNKSALGRAGVTVFGGVVGSPFTFPRLTAPTTAQSLAEGAAAAAYDQVFDQVKMYPHRIVSMQKYSRLAMAQAPGLEAIIWDDHMQVQALRADYLGINGAGANDEPLGILNAIGINAVPFAGSAANAYKNAVAMETAIRKANIDEPPVFITTSASRGMLKSVARLLIGATVVAATPVWEDDDEIAGRAAWDSQQVPNDVLIALVARHLMLASWAGMSVVLDTIQFADQDKYRLTMNQYIDWGLRHVQAVSRSPDSLAVLS